MDHVWIERRPHLASLVHSLEAILRLADELYQQGRATGESVDYGQFEERVSRATASVEQPVHQVALSGLDVDAPYIRVWVSTIDASIASIAHTLRSVAPSR
jgi:hypothetical protein